mmetsp:Transcript_152034/g.264976  ORF Transcript_152034/g.264976 Transcript_152034/m.264976 type:complete len:656 (-) Transcript_152034:24-1991(-)
MEISKLVPRRNAVPLLAQRVCLDVAILWILQYLLSKRKNSVFQQFVSGARALLVQCLPVPWLRPIGSPRRLSAPRIAPEETGHEADLESLHSQFELSSPPSRRNSKVLSDLGRSGSGQSLNEQGGLCTPRRSGSSQSPKDQEKSCVQLNSPQPVIEQASATCKNKDLNNLNEESSDKNLAIGAFGSGREARFGDHKLVLVMVGLPARGKSYITKHLRRYLSFEGFGARIFNAGDYRRRILGAGQNAEFFDPGNSTGLQVRDKCAMACMEDLLSWLSNSEDAHVGILDATNTTVERRAQVLQQCSQIPGIRAAFLESICTDEEVLNKNYAMKLANSDYSTWEDKEAARADFVQRAARYERIYETVEEAEDDGNVSFMKILNCGEKMVQRRCEGFLVSKVASYMLNLHVHPRVIYLCRHGLSEDNAKGKIGGDASLTREGMAFAKRLRDFMRERLGWNAGAGTNSAKRRLSGTTAPSEGWILFTSQLRRTRMTARPLFVDKVFVTQSGMRRVHTALLNEINAGVYEGYTMAQLEKEAPSDRRARDADKLRYRYPKGESYLDVVQRVRPVVFEMERERRPVLCIAHQAVIRCMLAFFQSVPLEDMPTLEVPLHTVLQLTITPHGCDVKYVPLDVSSHESSSLDEEVGSPMLRQTSMGG